MTKSEFKEGSTLCAHAVAVLLNRYGINFLRRGVRVVLLDRVGINSLRVRLLLLASAAACLLRNRLFMSRSSGLPVLELAHCGLDADQRNFRAPTSKSFVCQLPQSTCSSGPISAPA